MARGDIITLDQLKQRHPTIGQTPVLQATQQPISSVSGPEGRGFFSRAADTVTDFVGARGIADQFGASGARTAARLRGDKEAVDLVENPSFKTVAGSAIQSGANFIPGLGAGASLGSKALAGAATGFAVDVGSDLQRDKELESEDFKPGVGTLIGGGIPVVGQFASKIIGQGPKALEKMNLRLTPKESQDLARQGKDVAEYLTNKKIVGTPERRLRTVSKLYDEMEDSVSKLLDDSSVTIPKDDLALSITSVADDFADDPFGQPEAKRQIKRFISFLDEQVGDAIDVKRLNAFKRKIFKRAYSKNQTDVLSDSLHAIGSKIKDILDNNVDGLLPLSEEYGKIIVARRVLSRAATRNQAGVFTRGIAAATGAAGGGAVGGFAGGGAGAFFGEQAANRLSTPIRSGLSASLKTVGDVLNNLPVDSAGNVPVKALIQFFAGDSENEKN